jgi:hypothetical protein
MSTATDNRTLALERARQVKDTAGHLRAEIRSSGRRAGALKAADAVRAADSAMRFLQLLRAVPRIGETSARKMLGRAQINPYDRVDADLVTARRRQVLVDALTAYANRAHD